MQQRHSDTFTNKQSRHSEQKQEEFLFQDCLGAGVEYLDRTKVLEYARLQPDSHQLPMQNFRDLCRSLDLTSDLHVPRRWAVLAFHPLPNRYLPSALVRVTMSGLSSEEPYLTKDIEGPLSEQVERTIKWLTINLHTISKNVGSGQRIDRCEIPERALRELIVNALLHRNYMARESVHVEITFRQVIVSNPGQLDAAIERTEPPFTSRFSRPRNSALLRILEAQHWAEGRSIGFSIIQEEFEKYNLSLPTIGTP